MVEIKFDPTSSGDRRAVRALLDSYEISTQTSTQASTTQGSGYAAFVNRRSKRPGNKSYILDFLDAMNACGDLVVEVQEASNRVVIRHRGSNVVLVHRSGRTLFKLPYPPRDLLLGTPPASEEHNGWTTQLYLGCDDAVKLACDLVDTLRELK